METYFTLMLIQFQLCSCYDLLLAYQPASPTLATHYLRDSWGGIGEGNKNGLGESDAVCADKKDGQAGKGIHAMRIKY